MLKFMLVEVKIPYNTIQIRQVGWPVCEYQNFCFVLLQKQIILIFLWSHFIVLVKFTPEEPEISCPVWSSKVSGAAQPYSDYIGMQSMFHVFEKSQSPILAPEIKKECLCTPASDMYSLGMVIIACSVQTPKNESDTQQCLVTDQVFKHHFNLFSY